MGTFNKHMDTEKILGLTAQIVVAAVEPSGQGSGQAYKNPDDVAALIETVFNKLVECAQKNIESRI